MGTLLNNKDKRVPAVKRGQKSMSPGPRRVAAPAFKGSGVRKAGMGYRKGK